MTQHATYPQTRSRTPDDSPVHDRPRAAPDAAEDAPVVPAAAPGVRVGAPAGAAGVQTAGMHKALTDEHSRPGGVPTAGAAPVVPGAIPAATPAAPATPETAPAVPGPGGPRVPGEGRGGVSRAGAATTPAGAAPAAGEATAATREEASAGVGGGPGRMGTWSGRLLAGVIALGILVVAGVGFAASYDTLREAAEAKGFSHALSYWVPIAIDGAILAFLGLDLYFTHRRIPKPLLRFAAHGMTLATVVLNATSGGQSVAEDPVRAFWHGLMPVLFVIGVEALRHAVLHAAQIEAGTATERIPLHRWALAPVPTARLYRRMRLAGVRSYDEMIGREQALEGYRVWLTQELGGDLSKATDVQRLPMTMAPKGFTVDEALALPAKWKAEADERARAEAERESLAEAEAAEREAELKIKKLAAAGRVEAAQHRLAAETGTAAADAEASTAQARARAESAKTRAELTRAQAERAVAAELEAMESEEAAAARRRAAEHKKQAATAEAEAEAERRRTQAERAEADRLEAEAAEQRRRKAAVEAEAARAAYDAEHDRFRTAQTRHRIAVLEAEAATADDYADLSPRQRKARKVARMIVAAGGNADHVDVVELKEIEAAVGVGRTVASDIRKEAQELLAGGYDPAAAYAPQNDR
ncbi:DUF2637 domain-containing protein [Streptomyces coelicoflavus]|uniref:DUF2637 domain-containing protein n=1 Tax=Streptomyces coelicoflavus TaxID=285562 RepID=UPI0038301DFD